MTEFNPKVFNNSLLPQNIDAEESILGGILLDPGAIGRVADTLTPEAFYIKSHQEIYKTALLLHSQGKQTDLMTVTTWLYDHGLLEKVGGTTKLAQLVDRTVSAVNVDRYGALVMDKYLRRQLIFAAHEIVELGYDTSQELDIILDKAEQKIFSLTQKRPQQGLVHIGDTLVATFNNIENLHQEIALPGIPCGFYDLDGITSGFQCSDLIIIAGRPSMGKCLEANSEIVLTDGSVVKIEEIYHLRQAQLLTLKDNWKFGFIKPSAFVDDGIKPVFRLTTKLGRVIETTITHPYLTIKGWLRLEELKLGDKIAVPRQINVFGKEVIDEEEVKLLVNLIDNSCLSDNLQQFTNFSSNNVNLWLEEIVIYGKDNHQKNIPSIVFKLKRGLVSLFLNILFAADGYATDLKISQSQLSYATVSERLARQVQHLLLRFGVIATLENICAKDKVNTESVWQLNITETKSLKIFIDQIGILGKQEELDLIKKALEKNECQTNCDMIPVEIWEQIKEANGNKSLTYLEKYELDINLNGDKTELSRESLFELGLALDNILLQDIGTSEVYWDEIVSLEFVGNKQVYDLTIPETHNFVANDICVHNTSLALNMATNIAKEYNLPVAIFSLEMSNEQLAQRMLASEARIESNRLRSGRISQNDLEPLSLALGTLSELPIYIDDTANLTVLQMRSQVRRLQAEKGGQLGLVLLDYLQLMEGSGSDNRVQELSKMTRALKVLAREINAPVIALSQLSRGVEQRTNKRPMMSDLRESGSIEQDADLVIML
ncbi:MAG: replicative DNA helicase, partial [Moorea sp. SIO2B7]|nr:replicative DNA helicase [Moorena sp. SIO2B7]